MNKAVIVHGKPTEERYNNPELPKPHEANWLPWAKDQLEETGISVAVPAMPRPFDPNYSDWRDVFETEAIDKNTGLVGHSAGAEFILRWLSENQDVEVHKVALVAPYRDETGKYGDFSKYKLDNKLAERVGRITIFSSLDDTEAIQKNARWLSDSLPSSKLVELNGYGHFMIGNNMKSHEFPELCQELTKA